MPFVYLPPSDGVNVNWGPVSPELALFPTYHRANLNGGPVMAEIEVRGPGLALEDAFNWLRRPVYIRNGNGMDVWWGLVNEVRYMVDATTYSMTLDDVANRVAVAYSEPTPDGASQRRTTAWLEDTISSARYGVKDLLESIGTAYAAQAVSTQARLLAERAKAQATPEIGSGGNGGLSVLLLCVGWMETFGWRIYNRLQGRIEFDGDGGRTQAIGWAIFNDNRIGFGGGSIQDMLGRLGPLTQGNKVTIAGSTSNNGTVTLLAGTSETPASVVSGTIYFETTDDIKSSQSIFGFVKDSYWIKVSGSSANSRYHKVGATGDQHIRTSASVSGNIVAEGAGPNITIEQGQKISVLGGAGTWEAPGASVTLSVLGSILAQSFVVPSTMKVAQVGVRVGKIGNPGDSFKIDLYNDSSGSPGSYLWTGTLAANSITDSPEWRWVPMPNPTLNAGTYWLVVTRTGAEDGANCYAVALTKTAYGSCKAWTGSGWVANSLGEYLPFKVWAGEDTADQMRRIVADVGQFVAIADAPASTGIVTNPYRDEDETALGALTKLIESGTTGGGRLLAMVSPERVLRIVAEPAPNANPIICGSDGIVRQAGGSNLPEGYLPVGQWADVVGLSPALRASLKVSPVLIEEAEYDWREGTTRISKVRKAGSR
jgi:hypothetical protein